MTRSPEALVETGMTALVLSACLMSTAFAEPRGVAFSKPQDSVETYDFVEITATVDRPDLTDPFTNTCLAGTFQTRDGSKTWNVEGFCDSDDGSTFRIRFMAPQPGDYSYTVNYKQGQYQQSSKGEFHAIDGHRRGPVAVDPNYPWHFIWSGTGE